MPLKLRRSGRYTLDKLYTLHIRLLDNTVMDINIPLAAKGKDCLQKVAQYIGLFELEYFGLQFLTKKDKLRWVDLDKCLRKQLDTNKSCKGGEAVLLFKVQFFVPNCSMLQQEITRYLYYLQLKSLVLSGKLKCNLGVALKLAALAVQAELGTNEKTLTKNHDLDQFVLLPSYLTHKEDEHRLHEEILLLHKENRYDIMTAANAEKAYIQLCQEIPQFGCELFNGKDKEGLSVEVGASYHGVHVVYVKKEKVNKLFEWQDIEDMAFNRQNFILQNSKTGENYILDMGENDNAKYLWKVCINQHQFFRTSNNTFTKTAFRTHKEITTDVALLIKVQGSPAFTRRVTLTKKKALEKHHAKSPDKSPSSSASGSVSMNGSDSPNISLLLSNTLDDTEFLHRYEDLLVPARERGNSSLSHGSTPSSDYNSSDSDESDLSHNSINSISNGNKRPVSLIVTRLTMIASEHRDLLLKHLEQLLENNQLSEEFKQIFSEKAQYSTACASNQVLKNRNSRVLPYDDNRVFLTQDDIDGSDYINASPIKMRIGKKLTQSFIAAQSPLQHTTNDFWNMIWKENIGVIVMMSKLQEKGEDVCYLYWPNDVNNNNSDHINIATYNQVKVKQNFVKCYENYIVRRFILEHDLTDEKRTLFHVQYNQWPVDCEAPKCSKPFIEFLDEVHSIQKISSNFNSSLQSLLVHCEDGASRTGVFILISTLLGIIEQNETLDIPITLAELRMQRMHLVGSVQQYKFVYTVLVDYLRRNRLI